MALLPLAISALVGYLLGSIPSGLLIGRWMRGVDIRGYGSGRTGATNAMRSLGARGFALTFVSDAAKAIAAVLVARMIASDADLAAAEALAGAAAVIGHNWSLFINFGGGRGVASSFGAMLVLFWPGAVLGLLVAAVLIWRTRFVSLGSIVGTISGLLGAAAAVVTGDRPLAVGAFAVATAALVVVQHRDNIARLRAGTERKIGQRAESLEGPSARG